VVVSEKPLNEYIDLEAYDVVTGETYRALQRENTELKLAVKLLRQEVEEQAGWPVPAEPLEQTPPEAWGGNPT
jgi:hypothetical protein